MYGIIFWVFTFHVTTIVGIIVACITCFVLMTALIPGYLNSGNTDKALTDAAPPTILDKTSGLSFKIIISVILLIFFTGSFVGITFPFTLKVTRPKIPRSPFHQHGKK
jgi:hypothetical protein